MKTFKSADVSIIVSLLNVLILYFTFKGLNAVFINIKERNIDEIYISEKGFGWS